MPILLLTDQTDSQLHQQIQAIDPQIQIVTPSQLREEPEQWEHIEIAYGGIGKNDFERATGLKWFQLYGAGADRLPLEILQQHGTVVTNVSGIHAQAITEAMFGMLLLITRGLGEIALKQHTHQWDKLTHGPLESLFSKTLGILGVGEIGSHAARVGKAFGMKVIGLRRSGQAHPDIEAMYTPDTRQQFFAQSNVVMNILPLTDESQGFMGHDEFAALPQGAIVINAGRGATIQTEALMEALQSGHLRVALLDVVDPEPLPADHPLWQCPNVFITPHISGSHPEYHQRANAIFIDNLRRYLAGEKLTHQVDTENGY